MHTVVDRLLVKPEIRWPERDILLDRRREYLVIGVLEDNPDKFADLADICIGDRFPPDKDGAGCGSENAIEVLKKGAFPGTVRSDDRNPRIPGRDKIDIVERFHSAGIKIGEVSGFNEVHVSGTLNEKN
jgi:hypothetical protein